MLQQKYGIFGPKYSSQLDYVHNLSVQFSRATPSLPLETNEYYEIRERHAGNNVLLI